MLASENTLAGMIEKSATTTIGARNEANSTTVSGRDDRNPSLRSSVFMARPR